MPDASEPGGGNQTPPVRPGRSVFEEPETAATGDEPATGDTTDALPAVGHARPSEPGRRRVLDGAAFGVYDDGGPASRWPRIVVGLLAVSVVAVGLLVWRAVQTDAELVIPTTTTTTTPATPEQAPTGDAVLGLVPDGLDTCVAPEQASEASPPRAAAVCPRSGVPEMIVFVLYASLADRNAEFATIVDGFGVPSDGADCALGQNGVHDYIGFERVGRLACLAGGGMVDFVWTSDEAPLLVRARGPGSFVDHYAFWDRIVDRTDAGFPVPAERALLDRLPYEASACRRDLELNVDAAGLAAVACEPPDAEPTLVSSVQFDDPRSMAAWIDTERSSVSGKVFSERDDACTPSGFGRRPLTAGPGTSETTDTTDTTETPPDSEGDAETTTTTTEPAPAPDAGFSSYDHGGSTGQVLCFASSSDENVLIWVRDGSLVGSVAVSDRASGATMRDLLEWWDSGGHRP